MHTNDFCFLFLFISTHISHFFQYHLFVFLTLQASQINLWHKQTANKAPHPFVLTVNDGANK